MPFTGLPGEELISTIAHRKRFHDIYGEGADAKTLYKLQQITIRFAPIWPRTTFLLESLVDIYLGLDNALVDFERAYSLNDYFGLAGINKGSQYARPTDLFDFFVDRGVGEGQKGHLMLLEWALQQSLTDSRTFMVKSHGRHVLEMIREKDRKSITDELLSQETAEMLAEVPVDVHKGFWAVRKEIILGERMLEGATKRLREALQAAEARTEPASKPIINLDGDVSYGNNPITAENQRRPQVNDDAVSVNSRRSHVTFSPPRSRSPSPPFNATLPSRGRPNPPLERPFPDLPPTPIPDPTPDFRRRSASRDSAYSHAASAASIVTWAPTEPDAFSISMKVFSRTLNSWVEAIAIMDTGCEGGNFISSAFMEEHLSLPSEEIEADPEGERMQLVDFAGKTDFKPLGKVKLKWYGRDIKSGGRRGTRTMQSEDYFRVAPHLSTEDGETPFQILLGKEWLHTHEVLTYRGLRLFKSRERKGLKSDPAHQAELLRRQQLREEAELERLSERLASDAASISHQSTLSVGSGTGSGGHSPNGTPMPDPDPHGMGMGLGHMGRSSSQSLSSTVTGSSVATNGIGGMGGVDALNVS